jgi:uncharacterized protein YndB with AHSA1/START domain
MQRDLHLEATYPHPPALVWEAITDPVALAEWLMPNDFRAVVGHEFQFRTKPAPGFDGIVRCRVLTVDPPKELAYRWNGGGQQTVVTFRLEATQNGTKLVLEQTGFAGFKGLVTSFILGRGWKHKLLRVNLPKVIAKLAAQQRA